jgi:hypothetical protein
MSGLELRDTRANLAGRGIPEADERIGFEPDSVRRDASGRPCKRQSPRQDRSFGSCEPGDADRRWESKPRSRTPRFIPGSPLLAPFDTGDGSPRRKSIGADARRANRHVGPGFQKWNAHPSAGTNLRRAVEKNPGAPPGEHLRKEELSLHTVRPARPQGSPPRVAEHRAEKRPRRCMTRGWTAREK